MNRFLGEVELPERAAVWARRVGIEPASDLRLIQPALCVLDMQNDFLQPGGRLPAWGGPSIVPGLARIISAFRTAGRPVLFSRHICLAPAHAAKLGVASHITQIDGLLSDGSPGAEITDALRPAEDEYVITKYRYSAFYGTCLEVLLRAQAVQDIVIAGVVTNVCCETTAHDAFFRDFGVVFLLDGTAGFDEASHVATLATIRQSYGHVATVSQVCRAIESWRSES